MSLLTRIVKSVSVVDDRPVRQGSGATIESIISSQAVLKRQLFAEAPRTRPVLHPVDPKQSHIDELNRLKVEIEKGKAELRALRREAEEARAEAEALSARQTVTVQAASNSELGDLAKTLIDGANAQAEEIVAKAREESAQILEKAQSDGYLEGFSKGYEEAAQEFRAENEPKVEQLSQILDRLSDYELRQLRKNERDLVELVLAIAHKILGRAVQADPTVVADMLRDALEQNHREEYIRITLSKDMAPVDAKASDEVRQLLSSMGADVTVLVDSDLPEGSVLMETPGGYIDLSVETQMSNLHASILSE